MPDHSLQGFYQETEPEQAKAQDTQQGQNINSTEHSLQGFYQETEPGHAKAQDQQRQNINVTLRVCVRVYVTHTFEIEVQSAKTQHQSNNQHTNLMIIQ